MDAARRVVPLGQTVIKQGRVTDARTKVGEAGMERVRVFDPKATGPGKALLAGLQQTTLPTPLRTALERYQVGAVYTDAYAAGYLESAVLAEEMERFSRVTGEKAVPLVHALGAAYAFHQLMVVVDEQAPVRGEPRTRVWVIGNNSSFTAFSALACATVAEKTGPAGVEVLRTFLLTGGYTAEIRKDATGTYIQTVLEGTDSGPRVPFRAGGIPADQHNFLTIARYLGRGPGSTEILETLDSYSTQVRGKNIDDDINLALEAGDPWQQLLALRAIAEGLTRFGGEEGFGDTLKTVFQAMLNNHRGREHQIKYGFPQKNVVERNEEAIAFLRWACADASVPADIRDAFDWEAVPLPDEKLVLV
ncbi:MAG: hypothetical protein NT099_05065 [Candidatus Saganbacteria bacterium]|nr:hypothetical protein [Candidatus Saganbacteria bacterium]